MHFIGHRASATNPLRSLPLLRPTAAVTGWTALAQARALLDQAERTLPQVRDNLRAAHAELGHANRRRTLILRRAHQAAAMGCINQARAALRNAHRKLDAARADLARLENEPELPFTAPLPAGPREPRPGFPSIPRILREDMGAFPRGTVITIDRSKGQGWHTVITRPGKAGGIASHHDTHAAAQAWVDVTLAAPVLH